MKKLQIFLTPVLAVLLACAGLVGCQTTAPTSSEANTPTANQPDIRKLRTSLPGKSMASVANLLGQPAEAVTLENREAWEYHNAARDSFTGKTVEYLEIVFINRRVTEVNFSY